MAEEGGEHFRRGIYQKVRTVAVPKGEPLVRDVFNRRPFAEPETIEITPRYPEPGKKDKKNKGSEQGWMWLAPSSGRSLDQIATHDAVVWGGEYEVDRLGAHNRKGVSSGKPQLMHHNNRIPPFDVYGHQNSETYLRSKVVSEVF